LRIENIRAKSCFCETDNRWFIGQTKTNKLIKFGYTMPQQLKYTIDMQFELSPNTWPAGLIDLKET